MTPWDSIILPCCIFIHIPIGQTFFSISKAEIFKVIELTLTFMREIVLKAALGVHLGQITFHTIRQTFFRLIMCYQFKNLPCSSARHRENTSNFSKLLSQL